MRRIGSIILSLVLMIAAGCAAKRSDAPAVVAATQPSARAPNDPAFWTLEQVGPAPELRKPSATQQSDPPSLEALSVYAAARAAQIEGNRANAIRLYERARQFDPGSFEVNYMLGLAQLGPGASGGNERALEAFERAEAINPDHLGLQIHVGRIYFNRGNLPKVIHHLRLAMQTTEYASQPESQALIDFWLGRALQQKGYDLAALARYERIVERLPRLRVRSHPELYYLVNQPETLLGLMGQLNEKHGRLEQALACYAKAAEQEPNSFEFAAQVVRIAARQKKFDVAKKQAGELLVGHRASKESVELFKTVYEQAGQGNAVAGELRKLLQKRPGDRFIVFALADVLRSSGKPEEAETLLSGALRDAGDDAAMVSRLFDLYVERGQTQRAATLVIDTLARHPSSLHEMEPLWSKLFRSATRNRLRLATVQKLEVSSATQASKLYWVARTGQMLGRDALARNVLEQAAAIEPPFAPAYRELAAVTLAREDLNEEQKKESVRALAARVRKGDPAPLSTELLGRLELATGKPADAVTLFESSLKLGGNDPSLYTALATALRADEKSTQADQMLWKLVGEYPTFEPAYQALFQQAIGKERPEEAVKVLQRWLVATPSSVQARLWQFRMLAGGPQSQPGEAMLSALFRDEPDNPLVLAMMERYYAEQKRTDDYVRKLEEARGHDPSNRAVVESLARHYSGQRQLLDALRVIDEMRRTVAGDVEQMYLLSHLYEQVNHRAVTETVLQDVLKLDPQHAPANNDLGYMWADEGKNLPQAETMIRTAVTMEPDNSAYLDSLGWVLYKRGKFDEARRCLKEATQATDTPDPVVLDHYADVLYRLNETDEASKIWQRSLDQLDRLQSDRDDLAKLKLQLRQKLRQHRAGQPPAVAPAAEGATAAGTRAEK